MTVAIGLSRANITVPVLMHVVQRNRLEPGSEIVLTLRTDDIHLMPENPA